MTEPPKRSRTMFLRAWGPNACFTRPEMKVERVSYDVMTPSAARGVLEAILWKPAIGWVVERIDILKPIRWESVRRNEVGSRMSPRSEGLFIEEQRQQRAGLFLRDVDYLIHAHFKLTDKAGPEDTVVKFQEMFQRRAENGQCFNQPYLGCREFSCSFEYFRSGSKLPTPTYETPDLGFGAPRDLGFMLYDMAFSGDEAMPMWFRATIDKGTVIVPALDSPEVRR